MNPKYLLAAAAALSLGACTTDDTRNETGPEKGGYKISFTIAEDSETRTTLDKDDNRMDILRWLPTDRVGIFTANGGGNSVNINAFAVPYISYGAVTFVSSLENSVSEGDMFYAYYPYDEEQSTDPAEVNLSIPAEQTQSAAGVYNGQSQPLVAVPMDFQWEHSNNAYSINGVKFRLLGAIVELQIYSSDEMFSNEKIRWVAFESDTPLAGDFRFDLTSVTDKEDPQISEYECSVARTTLEEPAAIPATKDEAARIYLTIAPGKYTGRIVVETNITQYTFTLAQEMTFNRAVIKGLPADLAGATRELDPDASIRFADPEVKKICVKNWDTNKDDELSYREAAAVKSIGELFRGESISSFDELRYFTGLQSIKYAFSNCKNLMSIHIPEGVTAILDDAFYKCSSLTSILLPEGVTAIGDCAFMDCSSLESIQLPNGVTKIGEDSFYNCGSLTSINIPDGVTTIGALAFSGCSNLTSIKIPQMISFIGIGAFEGCSSLSAFYGMYASTDNRCLIQNDGTLLAFAPEGRTEYTIPNEVTTIGYSVFKGCSNLTSIHIPKVVTTIEESAFNGCRGLMSINIPDGVTAIKHSTFHNCSSLTSIHIPDDVTSIGSGAFRNCSGLTEIHIPAGVTAIEFEAFKDCSSLTNVYCKPTTPPTLGSSVFDDTPTSMTIYVPAGSGKAYTTATDKGWSDYASKIVEENN